MSAHGPSDAATAAAFSKSWNHLERGSVYTRGQVVEWLDPVELVEEQGKCLAEEPPLPPLSACAHIR